MKKDFLALADYTAEELKAMIDLGLEMKKSPKDFNQVLKNKKLGMIFEKNSTRTRVSFEVGIYELGGIGHFFGPGQLQLSRGEPISDTAQVLSRYLDGIMIRTFSHDDVEELAKFASIPVINGLTDFNHPCQVMADIMTIKEKFGQVEGLNFTYVGDGNNMTVSLMAMCERFGLNFSAVAPENYTMKIERGLDQLIDSAKGKGLKVNFTDSMSEGLKDANIVYTDVWASMGQEDEQTKRVKDFSGYIVDQKAMNLADKEAIFMHCLPAHRGEEVSAEVIDGPQSVIFDEAENRLHAQKAVMATLMK